MTKPLILTTALALTTSLLFTTSKVRAQDGIHGDAVNAAESSSTLAQVPLAISSPRPEARHSLDVSPVSPFIGIYVLQYAYQFRPGHELMTGISYMNLPYDSGSTHAASLFLGYRLYLWKGLHVEYQLWPIYDFFYEKHEKRYYQSFDLWGEARVGYRIDFDIGRTHFYVNAQWLFGNGYYASNKPQSFHDEVNHKSKKLGIFDFQSPMIFTGIRL
jgi:hypothetical protein